MKVPILNKSQNPLPKYETEGAAGMDIRAMLDEPVRLLPGDRALIPTGLHIQLPHVTSLKCGDGSEIPVAFEADVRGRSGNFKKLGLTVHLGTIDDDYRGDVGVLVMNTSAEGIEINNGDRIGQLIINLVVKIEWDPKDKLEETARGEQGFGHTGTK